MAKAERQARILVIEDDPDLRYLIADVLAEEGYRIDAAEDGHSALVAVQQRQPDLIVMDLKMPRVDGWGFVIAYRAQYPDPAPIILCTAALEPHRHAREIGAVGVLPKPFAIRDLIATVEGAAPDSAEAHLDRIVTVPDQPPYVAQDRATLHGGRG